jgi:hypothetical protein
VASSTCRARTGRCGAALLAPPGAWPSCGATAATELGTTTVVVRRLFDQAGLTPAPGQVSAAQRQRTATDQHLTHRAALLGFASLGACLADRAMIRRWPSTSIASELGVHPATVRGRLDQHGLPRQRATRRPHRAVQRQTACWAAKRQARLVELGFADVEGYLRVRRVGQGWSLRRMLAELQVGSPWLSRLSRLGRGSSRWGRLDHWAYRSSLRLWRCRTRPGTSDCGPPDTRAGRIDEVQLEPETIRVAERDAHPPTEPPRPLIAVGQTEVARTLQRAGLDDTRTSMAQDKGRRRDRRFSRCILPTNFGRGSLRRLACSEPVSEIVDAAGARSCR